MFVLLALPRCKFAKGNANFSKMDDDLTAIFDIAVLYYLILPQYVYILVPYTLFSTLLLFFGLYFEKEFGRQEGSEEGKPGGSRSDILGEQGS